MQPQSTCSVATDKEFKPYSPLCRWGMTADTQPFLRITLVPFWHWYQPLISLGHSQLFIIPPDQHSELTLEARNVTHGMSAYYNNTRILHYRVHLIFRWLVLLLSTLTINLTLFLVNNAQICLHKNEDCTSSECSSSVLYILSLGYRDVGQEWFEQNIHLCRWGNNIHELEDWSNSL